MITDKPKQPALMFSPFRIVIKHLCDAPLPDSTRRILGPEDVWLFWRSFVATDPTFEEDKEHLVSVLLDSRLGLLNYHMVSTGTVNETAAHPREIFRAAVLCAAHGILILHNHPSGDPAPSAADIAVTKRMQKVASVMDIRLADHVLIGSDSWYSFKDEGLLL